MGKNMWAKVVQRGILTREAADGEGHAALVLRNPDGTWELPGGKVEYDETERESLEREVREETGLVVTAAEPVETAVRKLKPKKKRGKFAVVYRCAFEGSEVELSDEHVAFAWRGLDAITETNLKQVDEYRSLRRVLTSIGDGSRPARPVDPGPGPGPAARVDREEARNGGGEP
jgi:8-oxo-dGTP pyrophosphatase MutT (NUDIX family)